MANVKESPLTDNFIEGEVLVSEKKKGGFNPLTPYNFGPNPPMTSIYEIMKVKVSECDNVLSMEDRVLSTTLSITLSNGTLSLVGKEGTVLSEVSLPKDQFLKSVDYDDVYKKLIFTFVTTEGESVVEVSIADLVNIYCPGKGLKLKDCVFSIDESVVGTKEDIETINENLVNAINAINQNVADGFNTINGGINNEIRPAIEELKTTKVSLSDMGELKINKVDSLHYTLTFKEEQLGEILIPEDQFLESAEFVASASESDHELEESVVVGNPYLKLVFKVTGNKKVYTYIPMASLVDTYTSGNGVKVIDHVISVDDTVVGTKSEIMAMSTLYDKIAMLERKLDDMVMDGAQEVVDYDGTEALNVTTSSYKISNAGITNTATIKGKNVSIADSTLTNNARLSVSAPNLDVTNFKINGDFPKASGNAVLKTDANQYVVFKDVVFSSNNIYNGVEIANSSSDVLTKNILFENCVFGESFSNNPISIFATADNAVITLSNCKFKNVSNVLRISNRTNAKNVTINVVNCTVDQWTETQYAGFLCCQDYTSTSENVDANNLFGDGKITVNFVNLMHKGAKIMPSSAADVCGTKKADQIAYVYTNAKKVVEPYSAEKYPVITFV